MKETVISMNKKKTKTLAGLVIICFCFVIGIWFLICSIQQKAQQRVIESLQQLDVSAMSQIVITTGPKEIIITDNSKMTSLINAFQQLKLVKKIPLHKLAPGATAYGCSFRLLNNDLLTVTLPCLTLSVNGQSISGYYQIDNDAAIISIIQSSIPNK